MKRITGIIILLLLIFISAFGQDKMMSRTGIMPFVDLEDAQMLAESGPVVLFFFADWCPVCRVEKKNIEAGSAELGNITVLIVNYDKNKDLKKKYGVTYQHTYVQIDDTGEILNIWNGGGLDEILKQVVRGEAD